MFVRFSFLFFFVLYIVCVKTNGTDRRPRLLTVFVRALLSTTTISSMCVYTEMVDIGNVSGHYLPD